MTTGPARPRHGIVVDFDEATGLGALIEDPPVEDPPVETATTRRARTPEAPAHTDPDPDPPDPDPASVGIGGDPPVVAFHCTAIVDGTRTIAVGERVVFRLRAAHHGNWEAIDLVPVPHPG